MPLPSTGPISLSQVNTELGRSSTALIRLGETAVRTLAGVASGAIGMSNLRGKSAMSVTASDVSGSGSDFASSGPVFAAGANTTVTGGVAPYSYAWTFISGPGIGIISNPTAQNPSWANSDTPDGFHQDIWRVTVTDANGVTATTTITVTLSWLNLQ